MNDPVPHMPSSPATPQIETLSSDAPPLATAVIPELRERVLAALWDVWLIGKIAGAFLLVALIALLFGVDAFADPTAEAVCLTTLALVAVLLPVIWTRVFNGVEFASYGRLTRRLAVVGLDGHPAGLGQLLARSVLLFLPLLLGVVVAPAIDGISGVPDWASPALNVLGYVLAFIDLGLAPLVGDQRRTLRDRLTGTLVVRVSADWLADGAPPLRALPTTYRSFEMLAMPVTMAVVMAGSFQVHLDDLLRVL